MKSIILLVILIQGLICHAESKTTGISPKKVNKKIAKKEAQSPFQTHQISLWTILNYSHSKEEVMNNDIYRETEAQAGMGLGGGYNYNLSSHISIDANLIFAQRKYKKLALLDVISESYYTANLSSTARYWFWQKLGVGAGLFSTYHFGEVTRSGDKGEESVKLSDAGINTFDIGYLASVAFRYPFKKYNILIDSRYLWGTQDLSRDENSVMKTQELQFIAGVQFPLSL